MRTRAREFPAVFFLGAAVGMFCTHTEPSWSPAITLAVMGGICLFVSVVLAQIE